MKTVYRVQHKDVNEGPYTSIHTDYDMDWYSDMMDKHRDYLHPNLREDDLQQYANSEYVCGFDSMDILKQWFSGYIFDLIDSNFIIAEYQVEEYFKGISNTQVMFIPTTTFTDITLQIIQSYSHENSYCS